MKKEILTKIQGVIEETISPEFLLHVGLARKKKDTKIDLLTGFPGGEIDLCSSDLIRRLHVYFPLGIFSVCDDSVRFNLGDAYGGIAICDSDKIKPLMSEWASGKKLDGQLRIWATGYWIPEALFGDIATSKIIIDDSEIGIRLVQLSNPYPESLSTSVVEHCKSIIDLRSQTLSKQNSYGTIESGSCVTDISLSLIRLIFARSRVYLRGFRDLDNQVQKLEPSELILYDLALKLLKTDRTNEVLQKIQEGI